MYMRNVKYEVSVIKNVTVTTFKYIWHSLTGVLTIVIDTGRCSANVIKL